MAILLATSQQRRRPLCTAPASSFTARSTPRALLPLTQHAMLFHGRVAYHDSEGFALDTDERARLAADLGDKAVMILRNHGTLVAGSSVPEAFSMMWHLEMAMQAQVDALASGHEPNLPVEGVAEAIVKRAFTGRPLSEYKPGDSPLGRLEWPALLRMLDRGDGAFCRSDWTTSSQGILTPEPDFTGQLALPQRVDIQFWLIIHRVTRKRNEPDMTELILHHYDFSNFAEKVRLGLGFKGLRWGGVTIPPIAPKPDLTALTGGYRRTPVLQIGADVWCDTRLILRELERRHPAPALLPPALLSQIDAIVYWAENRLMRPITLYSSGMNGAVLPAGLQADRSAMRGLPAPDEAAMQRAARRNAPLVRAQIPAVEAMLADGRPWILGDVPTVADLAVYHPLWFLTARTRRLAFELEPFVKIAAWMMRVQAFGHGTMESMPAQDAIDIARDARPLPVEPSVPHPEDPLLGSQVRIRADDNGQEVVTGELIHAGADELALRRVDPRAGTVVVHFPRLGYDLRPVMREVSR